MTHPFLQNFYDTTREWQFPSGGGGYSFGEWREIEASKFGSNRIEFFPLMLFERDFST